MRYRTHHHPGLDEGAKELLRKRAGCHPWTLKEQTRQFLVCAAHAQETNMAEKICRRFAPFGGVELPEIPREPILDPPTV